MSIRVVMVGFVVMAGVSGALGSGAQATVPSLENATPIPPELSGDCDRGWTPMGPLDGPPASPLDEVPSPNEWWRPCTDIRPGARFSNGCTMGFILQERRFQSGVWKPAAVKRLDSAFAGDWYMLAAASCFSAVGDDARTAVNEYFGDVVFLGSEVALIDIDEELAFTGAGAIGMSTSVCRWGGPVVTDAYVEARDGIVMEAGPGGVVKWFGWGQDAGTTDDARARMGAELRQPDEVVAPAGHVYWQGDFSAGDAGAPAVSLEGRALGIALEKVDPEDAFPPGGDPAPWDDVGVVKGISIGRALGIFAQAGYDLEIKPGREPSVVPDMPSSMPRAPLWPVDRVRPSASEGCPGIRPGARLSNGCTMNWIWRDADDRLYVGSAGHCGGSVNDRMKTPDASGTEFGTVVMQLWEPGGIPRDYKLILIDEEDENLVNATMCMWGGPTADRPLLLPWGEHPLVRTYGWGGDTTAWERGRTFLPDPRVQGRVFELADPTGFVSFWGHVSSGDSGSPMMAADGAAVGVVEYKGDVLYDSPVYQVPGLVTGPTMATIFEWLDDEGYGDLEMVLGGAVRDSDFPGPV